MDWETLAQLLAPVTTALVALLAWSRAPNRVRANIRHDAEAIGHLPDSTAKTELLRLVEKDVQDLKRYSEGRRDLPGLILAMATAAALAWVSLWFLQQGNWLWSILGIVAILLGAVFVYGIFESVQRVPRDARGSRVKADGQQNP